MFDRTYYRLMQIAFLACTFAILYFGGRDTPTAVSMFGSIGLSFMFGAAADILSAIDKKGGK